MKKNNGRQRRHNDKRRRKAEKRRKATTKTIDTRRQSSKRDKAIIPDGYSTPLMKCFEFENPFAHLDDAQKRQIVKEIGKSAKKSFDESLSRLEEAIKRHNPEELIGVAALYTLFKGVGPSTDFTEEGHYTQAVVEVIQSLCLRCCSEMFGLTPVLHRYLFEILDLSKECSKQFAMKRISAMADCSDDAGLAMLRAMESARLQTQTVRNWGYPQQMAKITRDLLEPLEDQFRVEMAVGALEFFDVTERIRDLLTDRVFKFTYQMGQVLREKSLKKKVAEFCKLAGSSEEDATKILEIMNSQVGRSRDKGFFMLSYFHQFVPDLFLLSADQIANLFLRKVTSSEVSSIMDRMSVKFGELESENPEHLFMQSKIRVRPFMKVDDGVYSIPLLGLVHSFFLEIVENWIKTNSVLKSKYHDRRATFLEDALELLIKENFSGCPVHTSTIWEDPSNGTQFENDCFVVCGPLAIVFEAKSERVDDSAKRGAPGRLRDHYDTLVNKPAEQATRLAHLLETGTGIRCFQCKDGEDFEVDLTPIRRALCVSVTLDWFPAATLCWKELVDAKLVSSANRPSINLSLADLEVVLEVLKSATRRLHYFWRRTEWELNVKYMGDEHDLLVYYLSSGLAIPRAEDGTVVESIWLYDNSKELHRHYVAASTKTANVPPLPTRILTQWWGQLIDRLEAVRAPQMWDIACVLLDLDFERQNEFERQFKVVMKNVQQNGNDTGENGVITSSDHSESVGAVVAFAYKNLAKDERDARAGELAHQAHNDSGADRIVVIGRDVTSNRSPYDFVAFVDYSDFDDT